MRRAAAEICSTLAAVAAICIIIGGGMQTRLMRVATLCRMGHAFYNGPRPESIRAAMHQIKHFKKKKSIS